MYKLKLIILLFCCSLFARDKEEVENNLYNFMPESLHIMDTLLSIIPDIKDSEKYNDFKSLSINYGTGIVCYDDSCIDKDTIDIPAGLVISDKKAYEYLYNKGKIEITNRKLIVAKELFREYDKNVRTANVLYNKELQRLQKSNRRSWWEKNNIYVGFVIGVAVTIAIEAITVKAID